MVDLSGSPDNDSIFKHIENSEPHVEPKLVQSSSASSLPTNMADLSTRLRSGLDKLSDSSTKLLNRLEEAKENVKSKRRGKFKPKSSVVT